MVEISIQGGLLEFSEGTSAKWIFDVEVEKLRAEFFNACREDQSRAWRARKFLIDRLSSTFYNFIFTFPELTFHDFSLAPHQNIDISAK
jgi:hypothetical protein